RRSSDLSRRPPRTASGRQHLPEYLDGGLHLGHRAEGDAGVGTLHRREVPADPYAALEARIAELARRSVDVHEDAVRLRIRDVVAHLTEGAYGEVADACVLGAFLGDVLRVTQRCRGRGGGERVHAPQVPGARDRVHGLRLTHHV